MKVCEGKTKKWEELENDISKEFATMWADEMERLLKEFPSLHDVAFLAFEKCLNKLSINGSEEYAAAALLGQYWYKGNELYQLWIDGGIIPD